MAALIQGPGEPLAPGEDYCDAACQYDADCLRNQRLDAEREAARAEEERQRQADDAVALQDGAAGRGKPGFGEGEV
jgi:hypothetical protein